MLVRVDNILAKWKLKMSVRLTFMILEMRVSL